VRLTRESVGRGSPCRARPDGTWEVSAWRRPIRFVVMVRSEAVSRPGCYRGVTAVDDRDSLEQQILWSADVVSAGGVEPPSSSVSGKPAQRDRLAPSISPGKWQARVSGTDRACPRVSGGTCPRCPKRDPSRAQEPARQGAGRPVGAGYWGSSSRTLAAWAPFGPCSTSNSTACPSLSER